MRSLCPGRSARCAPALAALALAAAPVAARDTLGIYQGWGAFRDRDATALLRHRRARAAGPGRSVAPVRRRFELARTRVARAASRPAAGRASATARPISLAIGDARFPLVAGGADAWAPNAAGDARIVAAMRAGRSMSVETTGHDGRPLVDVYALRGAATAIDAAALGCLGR